MEKISKEEIERLKKEKQDKKLNNEIIRKDGKVRDTTLRG